MKKNMGNADRVIRLVAAAVFAALIVMGQVTGTWAIILGALAAIFVLTSMIGSCPLYLPFGFSTCARTDTSV